VAQEQAAMAEENRALITTYAEGSFGEIVNARLGEYAEGLWALLFFIPQILAAMLVGMILTRRGVLTDAKRHGVFFRRMALVALPLAVVGKGVYAACFSDLGLTPKLFDVVVIACMSVGGMAMAAGCRDWSRMWRRRDEWRSRITWRSRSSRRRFFIPTASAGMGASTAGRRWR
jgi:hypothetical protein